jgi:tetratricopeptide (TPR) repeat protein
VLLEELVKTCDQLFREGRYTAALTACEHALTSSLSPIETCRVLQLKARALAAEDGRWKGPAVLCLKEALALSEEGSEGRAQVCAALSAAYASVGAVANCKAARDAFVRIYTANPSPTLARFRPDVDFNLAVAYHEVERYDAAENAYLYALEATMGSQDPYVLSLKPLIQHNLIDVFQELERFEEADLLMHACYKVLPDAEYGAQIRNRRAVQALHQGDSTSAILWAEGGLGHASCDVLTRAALLLTKARILEFEGNPEDAHDCALEALRLAAIARSSRLSSRVSSFIRHLSKGV